MEGLGEHGVGYLAPELTQEPSTLEEAAFLDALRQASKSMADQVAAMHAEHLVLDLVRHAVAQRPARRHEHRVRAEAFPPVAMRPPRPEQRLHVGVRRAAHHAARAEPLLQIRRKARFLALPHGTERRPPLAEQGRFAIGYYHQRKDQFKARPDAAAELETAESEEQGEEA